MTDFHDFTTPSNSTETSRDRARRLDSEGTSAERATDIIKWLRDRGLLGGTSKEYAADKGFDSLPTWVTGIFSTMHENGSIERLTERRPEGRGAAFVYVHNEYVHGRPTKDFRSNEGITSSEREIMVWAIDQIDNLDEQNYPANSNWTRLRDVLKRLV